MSHCMGFLLLVNLILVVSKMKDVFLALQHSKTISRCSVPQDYDFLDMFNSFSDPWEQSSLIDQYSTENFEKMAHPFIKFIAYGGKSYAFTK